MYQHWVLPECGIVDGFKECKTWRNMLPGNTPARNPLDMQCFADVKFRLNSLIRLTESYDDNDPRKYTLITPNAGFNSINRVLQTTPSSKRIVQDIKEIPNLYKIIVAGGGILCERDSNISGGRAHKKGGWGGKRKKGVHTSRNRTVKDLPPEVTVTEAIKKTTERRIETKLYLLHTRHIVVLFLLLVNLGTVSSPSVRNVYFVETTCGVCVLSAILS